MADNKKSFILYSDLITIIEKLIIKDRENKTNYSGELFYHILRYVNDKDPIPIDFIVEMAFEPIKLQLKRDLKRYETIREKRSEAGKASAELRKQKSTNPTLVDFAQHRSTNPTVNDNVNVTVNDNDTVIMCESSEETSPAPSRFLPFGKQPIKILKEKCSGYSEWLNTISKKNQLPPNKVFEWLDAFELHLLGSGKTEETEKEFKRYFNSWVTSEIRQGRKPKVENQSKDPLSKSHEQILQETLIKKYGTRTYEG